MTQIFIWIRQTQQIEKTRKTPKFLKAKFLMHIPDVNAPLIENYIQPLKCPFPPNSSYNIEQDVLSTIKKCFSKAKKVTSTSEKP